MPELDVARAGSCVLDGEIAVHRLGFGAMRLAEEPALAWGAPRDREDAKRLLRHVVSLGVNLIDTADAYGPHDNETLIAEALHPYPQGLVVATKGGVMRPAPGRHVPNGRPEWLRACCDASLRRLRLDSLLLYQLHVVDPKVPIEESIGALADLKREGKIRGIGLSNVSVDDLERASRVTAIASVQNRYNLADRESEAIVSRCERDGVAFLSWFPLGAGDLLAPAGPLQDTLAEWRRRSAWKEIWRDTTPAQLALAWLLMRSPSIVAIFGTTSIAHLRSNAAAADLRLSAGECQQLEQAVARWRERNR